MLRLLDSEPAGPDREEPLDALDLALVASFMARKDSKGNDP
jgi:hypothetical protein